MPREMELNDDSLMPFGKYRNVCLQDVPAAYMHWLWNNGKKTDQFCPVAAYIRRNLEALRMENQDLIWDE